MSRVAKAPVIKPKNVEISFDNDLVTVKGPKGTLEQRFNQKVEIKQNSEDQNQYIFAPKTNDIDGWAQAGTARAIFNNMVKGVTEGFTKTLELVGVGYRAQTKGNVVALSLGFSHPVEYALPEGVTANTPSNTVIEIHGIDKQLVGQTASEIRDFRRPEPYKGKGIKYSNEIINRKEAKKK